MTLALYNTLTRRKDEFRPIDAKNVRMYVCGPTVYDRPHLGNARSVVVYDVLYRLLMHLYGKEHVTYVRNITDVDDKINAAAKAAGEPISALTSRIEGFFHADMAALNCLLPTKEPHATAHIKEMTAMIEKLLANKRAYIQDGHVLFNIMSVPHYGLAGWVKEYTYGGLSHRIQDDLQAGARVAVESYKKNPGDFVLWKPAEADDDPSSVFDCGENLRKLGAKNGRPGWHIECSAMSCKYLDKEIDIHGGGADLMFPHHENEIAQSCCAFGDEHTIPPIDTFVRYWVHNGFLTVNGEKMSKSLGNFTTVKDLLDKGVRGEVIRFALLSAKYSEPLDWNEKLMHDAKTTLDKWYRQAGSQILAHRHSRESGNPENIEIPASAGMTSFIEALGDDMNLPKVFSVMHSAADNELYVMARILGFFHSTQEEWLKGHYTEHGLFIMAKDGEIISEEYINGQINARIAAKKAKNWAEADKIRKELAGQGIILEDKPDGTTDWRRA